MCLHFHIIGYGDQLPQLIYCNQNNLPSYILIILHYNCPDSKYYIRCELLACFFDFQASNCGIVESILNWVKFKAQTQLNKKCSSVKYSKIKGIPKLDDANDAGKIQFLFGFQILSFYSVIDGFNFPHIQDFIFRG